MASLSTNHSATRRLSHSSSNSSLRRHYLLTATAAAALSTMTSTQAFVVQQPASGTFRPRGMPFSGFMPTTVPTGVLLNNNKYQLSSIRLYTNLSNNNNSGKKKDNIFKRAAKKLLPSIFSSEEEQRAELARKETKAKVKGGIQELLKDAPLPIRMMGNMLSPLLSQAATQMSEAVAEQQQTMEQVMDDTRAYLLVDEVALQALGEPIHVGNPFSQSSSTTIINGQRTVKLALGFPVNGSRASGTVQAQATDQGIQQLLLQVNGRTINVGLSKRSGLRSSRGIGKNHMDDNIIEAEIIEKDVDRK